MNDFKADIGLTIEPDEYIYVENYNQKKDNKMNEFNKDLINDEVEWILEVEMNEERLTEIYQNDKEYLTECNKQSIEEHFYVEDVELEEEDNYLSNLFDEYFD